MPLKKAAGNMYPWVTHVHSHLGGECPHGCSYCYVQDIEHRRKSGRYAGPIRLVEAELKVRYGEGKTIFIEHMGDLFAEAVASRFIYAILDHCRAWPKNLYVFQTKNPMRLRQNFLHFIPTYSTVGTTIESNRMYPKIIGNAPTPLARAEAMADIRIVQPDLFLFVTIEPVLDFDLVQLVELITSCKPAFVNIGADSKRHRLPEPSGQKIKDLIALLFMRGVEVRKKANLERLMAEKT